MSIRPWRDIVAPSIAPDHGRQRRRRRRRAGHRPDDDQHPDRRRQGDDRPDPPLRGSRGRHHPRVLPRRGIRPPRSSRSSARPRCRSSPTSISTTSARLEAADAGAACLRINPGNIGSAERVREVVNAAKANGCAIRIGVNAGSLENDLLEKYGEPCPEALVESALDHIRLLEDHDFRDYKVAVKASDLFLAVAAYHQLADAVDCPLHLGITEAGGLIGGTVKSSIGMGSPALGRDRRHHPRLALGRARGRGPRRLRDAESARHPQSRRPRRLLPVLRAPGLRRHPHRPGARGTAPAYPHADVAFGARLRRQRPRRSARNRHRHHRRRQRQAYGLPVGGHRPPCPGRRT